MKEIIRLETERKYPKLWLPTLKLTKLAFWSTWRLSEDVEIDDDENPGLFTFHVGVENIEWCSSETIPGIDSTVASDLGQAVRRDPDALPPRNALEAIVDRLYRMISGLGGGNALFAIKAGALTGRQYPPLYLSWTNLS